MRYREMGEESIQTPFLKSDEEHKSTKKIWRAAIWFFISFTSLILIFVTLGDNTSPLSYAWKSHKATTKVQSSNDVESSEAVVAADDARCSEIGVSVLRDGGHAVDAAVSVALCLGVVNPMASGIGGGGFMVVRSADTSRTQAFNFRETAPAAASKDMYQNNIIDKYIGALAVAVPSEITGLHKAWFEHGRLPWKTLFQPAIRLAKDGFIVAPVLAELILTWAVRINDDPSLQKVYAPNGELLQVGETCYNHQLGSTLEAIAEGGPDVFYNGSLGENLVNDVQARGGILTMDDIRNYEVKVTDPVEVNTMGFTFFGMPAPSSGTLGLALVLNILRGYEQTIEAQGALGQHRFVEALKHMFAVRMNLGDPDFVDISKTEAEMLSPLFAEKIRARIFDNMTFPPEYYMPEWSQIQDHGTSHFCIVDADRNAVAMTTSVNFPWGSGVVSSTTGILLNNQMADFSVPTEISPDSLPPSPANFIEPNKRPLSSMTPIIIVKDGQLVGVAGGNGGVYITPAVIQVVLNQFLLDMQPLDAVQFPRVFHKLMPNVLQYENWTLINGDHIELSDDRKEFLETRGHILQPISGGAAVQLIVQTLNNQFENRRLSSKNKQVLKGILTAVSDPRKDGKSAAY